MLEASSPSSPIYIGADRSSPVADRLLQDSLQSLMKIQETLIPQRIRPPLGMDSSPVESLIRIDVSHAGKKTLVEQKGLNGSMSGSGSRGERFSGNFERFRPQIRKRGKVPSASIPFYPYSPELTRIGEAKFKGMIFKREHDMGVLLQGGMAKDKLQPSGHAQMDPQGGSSGDAQKDVFPAPFNPENFFSKKAKWNQASRAFEAFPQRHGESFEGYILQGPSEASDDGFDFGQFRHGKSFLQP
jgi:hypothetical protein